MRSRASRRHASWRWSIRPACSRTRRCRSTTWRRPNRTSTRARRARWCPWRSACRSCCGASATRPWRSTRSTHGDVKQVLVVGADFLQTGRLRLYEHDTRVFAGNSGWAPLEHWLQRNMLVGQADSIRIERTMWIERGMDSYSQDRSGQWGIKDDARSDRRLPAAVRARLPAGDGHHHRRPVPAAGRVRGEGDAHPRVHVVLGLTRRTTRRQAVRPGRRRADAGRRVDHCRRVHRRQHARAGAPASCRSRCSCSGSSTSCSATCSTRAS